MLYGCLGDFPAHSGPGFPARSHEDRGRLLALFGTARGLVSWSQPTVEGPEVLSRGMGRALYDQASVEIVGAICPPRACQLALFPGNLGGMYHPPTRSDIPRPLSRLSAPSKPVAHTLLSRSRLPSCRRALLCSGPSLRAFPSPGAPKGHKGPMTGTLTAWLTWLCLPSSFMGTLAPGRVSSAC